MDTSHFIVFYGLLGIALSAFGLALYTRRAWFAVAGAVVGAPVCFILSLSYDVSPLLAVSATTAFNLAAAWLLRRGRRAGAALLLLPFVATVPLAVVGLSRPVEIDNETTANASLGDLDGDGDLDVVLAKGRHWPLANLVLLNDGKGGFTSHNLSAVADRSYSAGLADLDGDGHLDVVVGNDAPDTKTVYLNDGHALFHLAGSFGDPKWPTRNVTVSDLNGDGRADIAVANRGGPTYACVNDGQGRFPSCAVLSTDSVTTIAAADLTGDGAIDLVVPHRDQGQSYVYVNDGKGGVQDKVPFGPATLATRAVAVGDLDGDGRPDIVVGDETAGGASIYFNLGGRRFADTVRIVASTDTPYAIAIADLDGDGHADVVLGNQDTPARILLNDGTGRSFIGFGLGDDAKAVYGFAVGDVNGDRAPDIIAARSGAPSMVWVNSLFGRARPSQGTTLQWRRLTEIHP